MKVLRDSRFLPPLHALIERARNTALTPTGRKGLGAVSLASGAAALSLLGPGRTGPSIPAGPDPRGSVSSPECAQMQPPASATLGDAGGESPDAALRRAVVSVSGAPRAANASLFEGVSLPVQANSTLAAPSVAGPLTAQMIQQLCRIQVAASPDRGMGWTAAEKQAGATGLGADVLAAEELVRAEVDHLLASGRLSEPAFDVTVNRARQQTLVRNLVASKGNGETAWAAARELILNTAALHSAAEALARHAAPTVVDSVIRQGISPASARALKVPQGGELDPVLKVPVPPEVQVEDSFSELKQLAEMGSGALQLSVPDLTRTVNASWSAIHPGVPSGAQKQAAMLAALTAGRPWADVARANELSFRASPEGLQHEQAVVGPILDAVYQSMAPGRLAEAWVVQAAQAAYVAGGSDADIQQAVTAGVEQLIAKAGFTEAQLTAIVPSVPAALASLYTAKMNEAMYYGHISDNPVERAMFVAQIGEETAGLRTMVEYADGSAYNGRLGNYLPGDGQRFKGRGAIQITGRSHYEEISQYFGVDFVGNPALAADPAWAFKIAVWYWNTHNIGAPARLGNVIAATQIINGGQNGEKVREEIFHTALSVAPA